MSSRKDTLTLVRLRPHASDPLHDVHADDDRVTLVEDAVGHNLQDARKVDVLGRRFSLVRADFFHVRRELVKQVVDDVGGEDANVELLTHGDGRHVGGDED